MQSRVSLTGTGRTARTTNTRPNQQLIQTQISGMFDTSNLSSPSNPAVSGQAQFLGPSSVNFPGSINPAVSTSSQFLGPSSVNFPGSINPAVSGSSQFLNPPSANIPSFINQAAGFPNQNPTFSFPQSNLTVNPSTIPSAPICAPTNAEIIITENMERKFGIDAVQPGQKISQIQKIRMDEMQKVLAAEVTGTMFSLLSYEEIKKMSGQIIIDNSTNLSGIGSVNDPRMGIIKRNIPCDTCHKTNDCSGHYGRIELATPIIYPSKEYVRDIIYILQIVCNHCGRLMLNKRDLVNAGIDKLSGKKLFKAMSTLSLKCTQNEKELLCKEGEQVLSCQNNPTFDLKRSTEEKRIFLKSKEGGINEYTASRVYDIMNLIPVEDLRVLGFNYDPRDGSGSHPKNMILKALLVIPPSFRKTGFKYGSVGPGPLTDLYQKTVEINNILRKINEEGNVDILQKKNNIATAQADLIEIISNIFNKDDGRYVNNKLTGYKSLASLHTGKKEELREKLLGKRVPGSGRSVLDPAPYLEIGQAELPESIVQNVPSRRLVTNFNIDLFTKMIKEGFIQNLSRSEGKSKRLITKITPANRDKINLEVGDYVYKPLQDGDFVLLNRQPTIHRFGIMGHEVVVGKTESIRINPNAAAPYNADFDGDEMNFHVPQTEEALREISYGVEIEKGIPILTDIKTIFSDEVIPSITSTVVDEKIEGVPAIPELVPSDSSGTTSVVPGPGLSTTTRTKTIFEPEYHIDGYLNAGRRPFSAFQKILDTLGTNAKKLFDDKSNLIQSNISQYPELQDSYVDIKDFIYSGKMLFSLLFPLSSFNYTRGKGLRKIIIRNGILIQGTVAPEDLFNKGSIMDVYENKYGKKQTKILHREMEQLLDAFFGKEKPIRMGVMNLYANILTGEKSSNTIGLIMDVLSSLYKLTTDYDLSTKEKIVISRETYSQVWMSLKVTNQLRSLDYRLKKHGIDKFSGKGLFSMVLPEDFFYEKGSGDDRVVIEDGILKSGIITDDHIGRKHRSIIQFVALEYGTMRAGNLITDLNTLGHIFLDTQPLSITGDDIFVDDKRVKEASEKILANIKLQLKAYGKKLTDASQEKFRQQMINQIVDSVKGQGQIIVKNILADDNNIKIMFKSGAKGSLSNTAQMIEFSMRGQEFILGQRPAKVLPGDRVLAYHPLYDPNPSIESEGFCDLSYSTGLDPVSAFIHAMAARIGGVNTAKSTAKTGYISNKLHYSLADLKRHVDGSVRNLNGQIVQYCYGDSDLDPTFLVLTKFEGNESSVISPVDIDRATKQVISVMKNKQ